jgi:WD40 repeat protein
LVSSGGRGHLRDVAAHPAGRTLAAVQGSQVVLFDTVGWTVRQRLDPGVGVLCAVAFSPDGLLGAAAGTRGRVAVWDAEG